MGGGALSWLISASMADHLWQSTVVAGCVFFLTLACRRNRAAVRYGLWFAASMKFLLPIAPLVALGRQWSWERTSVPLPDVGVTLDAMARPFAAAPAGILAPPPGPGLDAASVVVGLLPWLWLAGTATVVCWWVVRWRRSARLAGAARPTVTGRESATLHLLQAEGAGSQQVRLLLSASTMEPGVFGIRRAAIVWPVGLSSRLNDDEVAAVLAHELSHAVRRDNLVAALQMLVEAVFWFHPMVWWIGARLLRERERACDEDVLARGTPPAVYAEAILKTCEHCLAPSMACVAGVTGSNLKTRIEEIMSHIVARRLSLSHRFLIGTVAAGVIATPIGMGMLHARADQRSQGDGATSAFAAASVRENRDGGAQVAIRFPPGRFMATNAPLRPLIAAAYGFPIFRVTGGPDWLNSARFDIQATTGAPVDGRPGPPSPAVFAMLRTLLEDRFAIEVRTVTEEQPLYRLVLARADGALGPRLRRSTFDCKAHTAVRGGKPAPAPGPADMPTDCGVWSGPDRYAAGATTVGQLAGVLSNRVSRFVVDSTGLEGSFDLDLQYTPDPLTQTSAVGGASFRASTSDAPSLFAALEEQLGLKLEGSRGPVPVLAIEHVEKPVEP